MTHPTEHKPRLPENLIVMNLCHDDLALEHSWYPSDNVVGTETI